MNISVQSPRKLWSHSNRGAATIWWKMGIEEHTLEMKYDALLFGELQRCFKKLNECLLLGVMNSAFFLKITNRDSYCKIAMQVITVYITAGY